MKQGWTIERKLGEGSTAQVYLAITPQEDRVALKVLALQGASQVKLFEDEVTLLVRLRHPAIASVLGYEMNSENIFGDDRGPCFWMEYVQGEPLKEATKKNSPEWIFRWLSQGLEALQYLHHQSILHGDLSPGNVLVGSGGHLRLLDFGLAGAEGVSPTHPAGTLLYLAPEKIDGLQIPASDLFSLGTLFYEALAGEHPRSGFQSLQELTEREARPLLEKRPDLASGYSIPARVIDRLIQIDLSQRFSSAEEALDALKGGAFKPPRSESTPYHSSKMLGAEEIFETLNKQFKDYSSRSKFCALHGITGVGKKRFLRELAFQCAIEGIPVNEILPSALHETLTKYRLQPPSPPQALLLKSLERLSPNDFPLLVNLPRSGILEKGFLIVMEWNDDGLTEESRRFFSNLLRNPDFEEIHLKNLNESNTYELLKGALGEEAAGEMAPTLYHQTDGNPLLLLKLVDLIRKRQLTSKKHLSKDDLEDLKNFHSLEDILLSRLEGVSEGEREILLFLAVAGSKVSFDSLAKVMKASWSDLKPILQSLESREIIEQNRGLGEVSLTLPSLGGAILRTVRAEKIRTAHQAWLKILSDRPPDDLQKIHHALALNNVEMVTNGARDLAEALQKNGRRHEALKILEEALKVVKGREETSRLLRIKTNLQNQMGLYEEALKTLNQVFELKANDEPLPLKTVKHWLTGGLGYQNLGQLDQAEGSLKRCIEEGERYQDPSLYPFMTQACSLLGKQELERGNFPTALHYLEKGLTLSGESGRRRAELYRNIAVISWGEKKWEEAKGYFQKARELYRNDHYDKGEFAAYLQEGNLALKEDDPEGAEAAYGEAEKIARKIEDDLSLALVWNNQGVLACQKGEIALALDRLSRSLDVFRPLGNVPELAECLKNHAKALASAGRFSNAVEEVNEIRELKKNFSRAEEIAQEGQGFIDELKEGCFLKNFEPIPSYRLLSHWNKEAVLRQLTREGNSPEKIRELLTEIFLKLPLSLKVSFAERWDFQTWVQGPPASSNENTSLPQGEKAMKILESLTQLNRELLQEEDMDRVLKHLMDAAMRLSKAEGGFLVVRSDAEQGPLPGFRVAVAQNVTKETLTTDEYAFSFSAIRRAMQTGEAIVTDNALSDPRFLDAKSVHLHQLKSILALPVNGTRGILGVFYLDHRFESGLFRGETLDGLKAFADLAALALQKAQMIDDLKKSNQSLAKTVETQSETMQRMEQELADNRIKLKHEYREIVGRSPKMLKVLSLVDKITEAKVAVWIYGESGTGKESIARALHFNSSRGKFPFASENCSALPENLMESELFGHKKGAFTQADRDKKGILEYANKGTLFLDEIADLSLNLQAKLLRFLQEGEFRPLGSNELIKVDVRVISASNRDLQQMVKEGKFREDLLYRLNGVTVMLPPLRERMEDLKLLSDHFLKKIAAGSKSKPYKIDPAAYKILMNYTWPGNIRELQNTLETAALFAEDQTISAVSLEFKPALLGGVNVEAKKVAPSSQPETVNPELARILAAIRDCGFHKGHAAEALGISRRNLYVKLEKYGVPVETKELKAFIDKKLG